MSSGSAEENTDVEYDDTVRGYIANTDRDWYDQLLARQARGPLEEVNFWKPSEKATFKALTPGEPVLFRLKSPDNAIGGFGFFQQFSVLPVWLAWETFGAANGVRSLEELRARLLAIRVRNKIEVGSEIRIGCILLVDPMFFARDEWVRLPADWKRNTVSGQAYDLAVGEGARVWRDCLARLVARVPPLAADAPAAAARYGAPLEVRPRLGQGGFRVAVMDAYGRACAVTTEHSLPVLDAAHIQPYAEDGGHDVRNGLLLRTDIHRLFDRGYVTVTPDYRFAVSPRLRDDYANGRTYYALEGRPIALPEDRTLAPSRDALAWHADQRFLR
jgi:putative restriction endonuclease